jgi:hypothetical protein
MIPGDERFVTTQGDFQKMKKLMTVMLGLSLLTGLATVSFAQDDKKMEKKEKKGKKGKKKKDDSGDKK